jgi:hypothetical protein
MIMATQLKIFLRIIAKVPHNAVATKQCPRGKDETKIN